MMSERLFEIFFVLTFYLGFLLINPLNPVILSFPLAIGLLAAYGWQRYLKTGTAFPTENELDQQSSEPTFWLVFGNRLSSQTEREEENKFLNFVAQNLWTIRLGSFLVMFVTLISNSLLGNHPRTWSFWINLLMIISFSKSLTLYHYWLCLFLNALGVIVFFVSTEGGSCFLLSVYLLFVLLLYYQGKLKQSFDAFGITLPSGGSNLPYMLVSAVRHTLLIFGLAFLIHWILPSKKPIQLREKIHGINASLGRWFPSNSHQTPLKNWSQRILDTRGDSEEDRQAKEIEIETLKNLLRPNSQERGGQNLRAIRGLDRLRQGGTPTSEELTALEEEVQRTSKLLENPERLSSEDKAVLRPALEEDLRGSEKAEAKLNKLKQFTKSPENMPFLSPKTLDRLLAFLKILVISLFLIFLADLLIKLLSRINPKEEQGKEEKKERAAVFQSCLDELNNLRRKTLSPREEIKAYYRLFLKMMSLSSLPWPSYFPTETYSYNLEQNFPKLTPALRLTNALFSRALYSLRPINQEELLLFRKHIESLFEIANRVS